MVDIIKLIKTTLKTTGKGSEDDPIRILKQYWDFNGCLILEYDPYFDTITYHNLNDK